MCDEDHTHLCPSCGGLRIFGFDQAGQYLAAHTSYSHHQAAKRYAYVVVGWPVIYQRATAGHDAVDG